MLTKYLVCIQYSPSTGYTEADKKDRVTALQSWHGRGKEAWTSLGEYTEEGRWSKISFWRI